MRKIFGTHEHHSRWKEVGWASLAWVAVDEEGTWRVLGCRGCEEKDGGGMGRI
jgi:hypothetical protein